MQRGQQCYSASRRLGAGPSGPKAFEDPRPPAPRLPRRRTCPCALACLPSSPPEQFPRLNLGPKNLSPLPLCFSDLGGGQPGGVTSRAGPEKSPAGIGQDFCSKPRKSAKNGKRSYLRRAQQTRRRGAALQTGIISPDAPQIFWMWGCQTFGILNCKLG